MKFSGIVGFWEGDIETSPGVWEPNIVERQYFGDVHRNTRRFQTDSNQSNDNLTVNNQISIISDLYMRQNWNSIRYIIWNNVKWKVNSVEVSYPRITLELGGEYNGAEQVGTT